MVAIPGSGLAPRPQDGLQWEKRVRRAPDSSGARLPVSCGPTGP